MSYAQRIDISIWALEQQQQRLKAAVDRGTTEGGLLRALIESTGIRINETRKMLLLFNNKFKSSMFNEDKPLYADYFVKEIRNTVGNFNSINQRIRLKMNQLKYYRKKLLADLAVKHKLSESIRPVDIETLKIENEQLTEQIALKTKHVNDLKTVSGHATQKVNSNKKRLAELSQNLKNLRKEVSMKKSFIAKMEQEEAPVIHEAQKAERALTKIRERVGRITAPDFMEYVRFKRDIRDLDQQISSLERRHSLQSLTASALKGRVKYLEQRKSGDHGRSSLREAFLRLENHGRRGRFLPERNPVLTSCLEKIPSCKEPLTCPPPDQSPPQCQLREN